MTTVSDEILALGQLLHERKWLAASVIIVGAIVRLLKSDTKIPIDVPPIWRLRLAFVLSIASAVLQHIVAGVPWRVAAIDGVLTLAFAVLLHNVVVDNLRGGREFVVPFLTRPGVAPGPGKPASLPPGPLPPHDKLPAPPPDDAGG